MATLKALPVKVAWVRYVSGYSEGVVACERTEGDMGLSPDRETVRSKEWRETHVVVYETDKGFFFTSYRGLVKKGPAASPEELFQGEEDLELVSWLSLASFDEARIETGISGFDVRGEMPGIIAENYSLYTRDVLRVYKDPRHQRCERHLAELKLMLGWEKDYDLEEVKTFKPCSVCRAEKKRK